MSGKCESHDDIMQEIRKVESKVDNRYEIYIRDNAENKANDAEMKSMIKALHKRLDSDNVAHKELADVVTKHMSDEMIVHEQAAASRARTNELLEHVATKEDVVELNERLKNAPSKAQLATTNGRVNTIWIIGSVVSGIALLSLIVLLWYIKVDINQHTTKASKANYSGTKKVIERIVK